MTVAVDVDKFELVETGPVLIALGIRLLGIISDLLLLLLLI